MELEILGAHCYESRDTRLVSLLVDQTLAIDAGGLTSSLSFSAQQRLRAVLITHQHFDHIRDLATLGLSASFWHTIKLYAPADVLEVISTHLLNGVIYPDFRRMPTPERPSFRFCPLEPYKEVVIEGYYVLPLPVKHSVPAVGYLVTSQDKKSIFYTGDTGGGCSPCWEVISPQLLVIEVSVPNSLETMAVAAGHLCPRLLREELQDFKGIKGYLPQIVIVHISPQFEGQIREEVAQVARELGADITMGYEDMKITL